MNRALTAIAVTLAVAGPAVAAPAPQMPTDYKQAQQIARWETIRTDMNQSLGVDQGRATYKTARFGCTQIPGQDIFVCTVGNAGLRADPGLRYQVVRPNNRRKPGQPAWRVVFGARGGDTAILWEDGSFMTFRGRFGCVPQGLCQD